jgi:Transferase family
MDLRNLQSQLTSTSRVRPTRRPPPTLTYLSIVDSTAATLGNAMALWVFERKDDSSLTAPTPSSLTTALSATLSAFPHFAGTYSLTLWPSDGPDKVPHEQRFRRGVVSYGTNDDPGVEVQVASLAVPVTSLFPDPKMRAGPLWCWDLANNNFVVLFSPKGETAGSLLEERLDTPTVRIRITEFACKNLAVAIKISHPLADAETMTTFMKAWGAEHRARMRNEFPPEIMPIFDPTLLDSKAEGDIDGPSPDASIVERSKSLPLPWYDWWEHEPGSSVSQHLDTNPQVAPPAEIPKEYADSRRRGTRIPWEEWDTGAPVSHRLIRLSSNEIEALFEAAQRAVGQNSVQISRHDVLLAFVWQLTALAKPPSSWPAVPSDPETLSISLDTTIGLRPRLNLPRQFLGSPILLAGLSQPYALVSGQSSTDAASSAAALSREPVIDDSALAATAAALHTHLARFDQPALAAWLHDMAFDPAPHRWWQGFLGSRHVLATSWIRAGLWDVDFGFGWEPPQLDASSANSSSRTPNASGLRWAGVLGPNLDGLVTLVEAEGGHGREWWRCGVDLDVKLESKAMERMQKLLTRWRVEQRSS